MADILGLHNFVKSDQTEKLLAAYGNDIGVFNGLLTFLGQSRNLSGNPIEMDVFLDLLAAVNRTDANLVYDGSLWITGGTQVRMPIAKYVKTVGTRMYLADLSYAGTEFRSRVWHTDDKGTSNNTLKWGYETGTNLSQTAQSKVVRSANAGFKAYEIKSGDPFFITTGTNAGIYHVDTIDSDQQITLVEELVNTATSSTYWVGSNWFDTRTNDSDIVRGLGENDNKLLVFKRESLHKYDTRELRRVKGAPGTTSHRSIVNIRENTFYFHDTGVHRYDGVQAYLISRPIQDWIDGISSGSYEKVVGWSDKDFLYLFVGNITNTVRNISLTNAVLIYDTSSQGWNIGTMNDVIRVATEAIETNTRTTYLGTAEGKVITWNSGNADISTPIPWEAATVFHFPVKAFNIIEFDRVEIHTMDGRGISVYYKLYGPDRMDSSWKPLGDINEDVTEIVFPRGTFGRGVAFKFLEISSRLPQVVSRIDVFYKAREGRNILEYG